MDVSRARATVLSARKYTTSAGNGEWRMTKAFGPRPHEMFFSVDTLWRTDTRLNMRSARAVHRSFKYWEWQFHALKGNFGGRNTRDVNTIFVRSAFRDGLPVVLPKTGTVPR